MFKYLYSGWVLFTLVMALAIHQAADGLAYLLGQLIGLLLLHGIIWLVVSTVVGWLSRLYARVRGVPEEGSA